MKGINVTRIVGFVAVVALAAVPAVGQTSNWLGNAAPDPTNWHDPGNWSDHDGDTIGDVPTALTDASFRSSAGSKTVDLHGTDAHVRDINNHAYFANAIFQSTGGPATLHFNEFLITERQSDITFNIPINGGRFEAIRKPGNIVFNDTVTLAQEFWAKQRTYNFNHPVTFNGGCKATYFGVAIGGTPVINVNTTITFGVGAGITVGDRGAYHAKLDGTLGVASTPINVSNMGGLYIDAAQSFLPTIDIGTHGMLVGTVKNPGGTHLATYSATGAGNVNLVEDSIVALNAGEVEPTLADLGTTKIWKGAVTNSTTQPDSATTPYKGIAVGLFTPSYLGSSTSYIGPTAGGDMDILWVANTSGASARYTGAKFDVTNPATDVVNINLTGSGMLNLRSTLKGTATTFHFHNLGAITRKTLVFDTQGMTAGQEIHVHDGIFQATDGGEKAEILGRLELDGQAMLDIGGVQQFTPGANTVIVLNDASAISVTTGEEATLELMTLGTDLIINNPSPVVYLERREGTYDFSGAVSGTPNPNMDAVLLQSDLCLNSNNNNDFEINEDMIIGDGKYVLNYTGSHKGIKIMDKDSDGSIIKAAPGASMIGFAMMTTHAGRLSINAPVDAGGGKVVFGSTTALTAVDQNNNRLTQVPAGVVELNRLKDPDETQDARFLNTAEVVIESGGVSMLTPITFDTNVTINTTLITNGNAATVTGTLAGAGQWTGGGVVSAATVSPGAGVGTLAGVNLEIPDAGTLEIGIADASNDLLDLSGYLALTGAWTLNVVDEGISGGDPTGMSFEIVNYGTIDTLAGVTFASDDFNVTGALLTDDLAGAVTLSGLLPGVPTIPGDANENGFVDDDDLAVLLSNWESDAGTITNWALGDFTGDSDVDDDDLAVLLGNWTGPPPGGAAVPEPATLALLGLGGLSVLRRRRK